MPSAGRSKVPISPVRLLPSSSALLYEPPQRFPKYRSKANDHDAARRAFLLSLVFNHLDGGGGGGGAQKPKQQRKMFDEEV